MRHKNITHLQLEFAQNIFFLHKKFCLPPTEIYFYLDFQFL